MYPQDTRGDSATALDIVRALSTDQPNTFHFYHKFHHLLLHGWPGALVLCGLLAVLARDHWRTAALGLVTFHLHLGCDLVGSRGPSPADLWPILYGEPLFRHPAWYWRGQWRLDGWQNGAIFAAIFVGALWQATRLGNSFVELFHRKADTIFMQVLKKWRNSLPPGRGQPD